MKRAHLRQAHVGMRLVKIMSDKLNKTRARNEGKRIITDEVERAKLVEDAHQWGHFGRYATYNRLLHSNNMWWPGMRADCKIHIASCTKCMRFTIAASGYHTAKSSAHKADRPFDHDGI